MDTNISADGGRANVMKKDWLAESASQAAHAAAGINAASIDVSAMAYSSVTPVIAAVTDDKGFNQGLVENGGRTDDGRPTLTGTAEAGAIVHFYNNNQLIGSAVAAASGDWSFTPRLPLADGRHPLSIIVEYPGGDISEASPPYVIIVDTITPELPAIGAVLDDKGPIQGAIANGGVTDDGKPTMTGKTLPGVVVHIYNRGELIGNTEADGNGNWSFVPRLPLADGTHQLAIAHEYANGDVSALSQPHVIIVDTSTSGAPVIGAVLDDQGSIQGAVANGGFTDDGRPTLTGRAHPNVVVHVYNHRELIGNAQVDSNGDWSFVPKLPLANGTHELTIIHEYPDGDISELSEPYVIIVDRVIPAAPVVDGIVDDAGRITGVIGSEGTTDDNRPTVIGTAEANATVIVHDKGKEIGRTAVDDQGNWSFTPAAALKNGTHIFTCWVMDRAGNQSEFLSPPFEFEVDASADRIRIYSADDNVGADVGTLLSGDITDDRTPTLSGTANADGIVRIYEGGKLLGQVVADEFGDWEFTPDVALSLGVHQFQATVTREFTGESALSAVFKLTVESGMRGIEKASADVGFELSQVLVETGEELFPSAPQASATAPQNHVPYSGSDLLGQYEVVLEAY